MKTPKPWKGKTLALYQTIILYYGISDVSFPRMQGDFEASLSASPSQLGQWELTAILIIRYLPILNRTAF